MRSANVNIHAARERRRSEHGAKRGQRNRPLPFPHVPFYQAGGGFLRIVMVRRSTER